MKQQIQKLIQSRQDDEVTPTTNYKTLGVYMIYIERFNNDRFIPFYIGQSKDVQKRYKKHYTELLALNRLSNEEIYHYCDTILQGTFYITS